MKYSVVVRLDYLEIADPVGRGVQVTENLFFSNDRAQLNSLLTAKLEYCAGRLEVDALRGSGAVSFSAGDWPLEKLPQHAETVLGKFLMIIQMYLTMLWIVRDNCVNTELGFITVDPGPEAIVSSTSRIVKFSQADGSLKVGRIQAGELRTARGYLNKMFGEGSFDPFVGAELGQLNWDADRVSRAIFLLQAARSESHLALKVTGYCICFETLVSTDNAELSHKVAERVAALLGTTTEDKLRVFRTIKRAYGVRSKTVHGAPLRFEEGELSAISVSCDDLLRKLFQRIIADGALRETLLSRNEAIDEYFMRLLFHEDTGDVAGGPGRRGDGNA